MLAARHEREMRTTQLFIGEYHREQVEGKWRNVVDVRPELNENISFVQALKKECEENLKLTDKHQLHFNAVADGQGDVVRLELEPGNYQTVAQLIASNPAVVVDNNFLEQLMTTLVETTTALHAQGVRHVCYSPDSVFTRKGDYTPLLMNHGSYYLSLNDQRELYGDDARYVAPEVLEHGAVDDRCDVYSIGKFMESIFEKSEIPRVYRKVIRKATSELPEDRYETPADMLKAVRNRRHVYHSLVAAVVACVLAGVIVVAYFDMFPEVTPVEYVKPAPRQATDDLLDDGFDPSELGVVPADSMTDADWEAQKAYEAKAEEIFRKKYEAAADRVLSKIYNKSYMNNSEKKFLAESESTIQELMELQQKLGEESNLDATRSQVIATEIIERLTEKKKKEMGGTNSRAIQK